MGFSQKKQNKTFILHFFLKIYINKRIDKHLLRISLKTKWLLISHLLFLLSAYVLGVFT